MECGAWLFGRGELKIQAMGTALGSRLSALGSRLSALGSRLSALGSRLSALGSRLSALGSRLSALGSRLSALGSRLSALGSHNESQRTRPLLSSFLSSHPRPFPNPAPFRPVKPRAPKKISAALCRRCGQYRAAVLNSGQHSSGARKAAVPIVLNVVPPPTGRIRYVPAGARTVPCMAVRQRFQPVTVVRSNGCVNHINVLFPCDIFVGPKASIRAPKR